MLVSLTVFVIEGCVWEIPDAQDAKYHHSHFLKDFTDVIATTYFAFLLVFPGSLIENFLSLFHFFLIEEELKLAFFMFSWVHL